MAINRLSIILGVICIVGTFRSQTYEDFNIKEKFDVLTAEYKNSIFSSVIYKDESAFANKDTKQMDGLMRMYQMTGDIGYLYKFIQESLFIMSQRHDVYYGANSTFGKPRWTFKDKNNLPTDLSGLDYGYSASNYMDGYIVACFAKFTYLIKNSPDLYQTDIYQFDEISPNNSCASCTNYTGITFGTFGEYSDWLQDRVGETLYYFIYNGYWDNDEGFRQTFDGGDSFNSLTVNQQAGFARAILYNGLTANNSDFISKAEFIADLMKGNIRLRFGFPFYQVAYNGPWLFDATSNSYSWYHSSWNVGSGNVYDYFNAVIEDMSHGAIDMQFYDEFYQLLPSGKINSVDMAKFHNTFTSRLYDGYGEFYPSVNATDYGYDGNAVPQSDVPVSLPHDRFRYIAFLYSILGQYDTYSLSQSNPIDNKSLYQIIMDLYGVEIHGINSISDLPDSDGGPYNYGSYATIVQGLAMLAGQQWLRECPDLSLYKRDLVYDQDFYAHGLLTIEPASESSNNYNESFALPYITDQNFTIEENVTSEITGGAGVTLKAGFSALNGSKVTIKPNLTLCTKSGGMRYYDNNDEDLTDYEDENQEENLISSHDQNNFEVKIFPNPAKETLFIVPIGGKENMVKYQLLDLQGKIVSSGILNNNANNISLIDLESGIYMLSLKNGESVLIKKVIKN